jgi:hypothetical protein
MASTDDIAVPDLSYFIEHDLRDAIRQMDERAAPASLPSEATGAIFTPSTGIPSSNAGLSKSYTKNKKKKKEKEPGNGARKFASPVSPKVKGRVHFYVLHRQTVLMSVVVVCCFCRH